MSCLKKEIGSFGENLAEKYLLDCGYMILDRNFRGKTGEIDIIGKDRDYITFIEVKTRYGKVFGSPCESVTKSKQHRIYRTAQIYIMKKKLCNHFFRFDVIEVMLNETNNNYSIKLIKDAFQL